MTLEPLDLSGAEPADGPRRWERSREEGTSGADARELEYRRYAAALLESANRTATAADKLPLLVMADAWLKLADKIGRLSRTASQN